MATITSLGFSIFSTYNGRGVSQARRDLNSLTSDLDRSNARLGRASSSFFSLGTAAASMGPALAPIGAQVLGVGAAFGVMGAAGLGAFAVLGAAFLAAQGGMKAMKKELKDSFLDWGKEVAPLMRIPIEQTFQAIAESFHKLTPLVQAMTPLADSLAGAFKHWVEVDMQGWISWMGNNGVPILINFVTIGKNLGRTFGDMLRAFAPMSTSMSGGLAILSARLKGWADGGGFTRFITMLKANGPEIRGFFNALFAALKNVAVAMAGLGPSSLTLATILLRLVASLPPSWIQAIVWGFVAFRAVMLSMAIISTVTAAIGVMQVVLGTLNFVLVALGITWNVFFGWLTVIIIAVAALVVGLIFLVQNWNAVWNAIKNTAATVWNFLTHGLGQLTLALLGPVGVLIFLGTHWQQIWTGMKVVAAAIWVGLGVAWRATVAGLTAAWVASSAALKAAWDATWNAMGVAARAIWAAMGVAWTAFTNALRVAGTAMLNALSTAWSAGWHGMQTAAVAVWNALRSAFGTFSSAMKTAMSGMLNALKSGWDAAWNAIKKAAVDVWNALRSAFGTFSSAMKTAMSGMLNALKSGWSAAWNAIKKAAVDVWNALRSAFGTFSSAMKTATNGLMKAMADAWSGGAKAIGKAWSAIKKLVRDPIQAVVNVVYNNGIVKLWNTVAGVFGAPKLSSFSLPGFATGGPVSGPGTGTSDSITARLSNDEHVITAAEVHAAGGHDAIARQRQQWLNGGPNGGGSHHVRTMGSASNPNFALGGGIHIPGTNISVDPGGLVKSAFDVVAGFGGDVLGKLAKLAMGEIAGVVNPLIQKAADAGKDVVKGIIPGSPWIEDLIVGGKSGVVSTGGSNPQDAPGNAQGGLKTGNGIIQKMADYIKNWITAHDVVQGGANVADAQKWADAQVGKPYQLGGFGSTLDCSSFMSGIAQIILGHAASPLFTTFAFTGAKQGPATFEKDLNAPFMVGVENNGIGHMAGTLNGTNYEATPPAVRKGPSARGAHDSFFDMVYGMKASIGAGGPIPSGEHLTIIDAALAAAGVPPPGTKAEWESGLNTLITRESNWNSGAVNNSDSNAAAGTPSKGLAQVIQPTFDAYHVAGTSNNILDPIANVAAAIRYIVSRYGNITNVQQANASLPPKGYRTGTERAHKGWHMIDEDGGEWINFRGGEKVLPHGRRPKTGDGSSSPVVVNVTNHWHGNPDKEAVRYAESGMAEKLRQACAAGVGGRPH